MTCFLRLGIGRGTGEITGTVCGDMDSPLARAWKVLAEKRGQRA